MMTVECPECGKRFSSAYALRKHFEKKHSRYRIECPACDHLARSERALRCHLGSVAIRRNDVLHAAWCYLILPGRRWKGNRRYYRECAERVFGVY